ncbi:MAG: serine/threonine protein kinase, partial [Kofleriaceae bacterium]|nr:serine/threonine protein kinase [Kofleriaceae bacterium]
MIGEVLDDTYRVVERIGAGAMGEVYLVEHIHIGRREAIKVLRPEMAADARLASRFRREARAINRLRHPNIIGIYDFGQLPDGRLYLTMELAAGELLDATLRREGRFEVPRALLLLHQMAAAIDHAHSHGVVHRDLKPGNMVLVEEHGHHDVVKVLDFGLAKVLQPGGGDELTLRGELFGTPEYMAPERLGEAGDDPRSDLYAIGCIACELLTGKPPFTGPRPLVMAAQMTQTPMPPGRNVPGVPPLLDTLIEQLLAKDPAHRVQSGKQLCAALEQVPGFSRKRAYHRSGAVVTQASPSWDGRVEIHEEITLGDRARAPRQMAYADTASAHTDEIRDEIFGALVELAQQTQAQHPGDEGLAIALAMVTAARDDRARIAGERLALEARQAKTLQGAREREGSLRFAIAELRYDRGRTP